MLTNTLSPESVLKQFFGYDTFRPLQKEIIETILDKKDALVLMPTGGGKSICYQIPVLLMDGIGIVVSPLIALMKDQVESLLSNGIKAAYLNSSQSGQDQATVENAALHGDIKLLYVSPEKLLSTQFQSLLRNINVCLFAIDEAHCISGWGHDFRPEYTQLNTLKDYFPTIPIIALTATADKLIRQDILEQLRLQEAPMFVSSFNRKNLSLTVLPGRNRITQIMDFLDSHPNEAGIIYCLSRNSTEELADKLRKSGFKASFYHAGMSSSDRSKVQEAFLKDDIQIICATIAFGMGIDKSNVRWVIHYNLPKNMESYYQEIGRAGRDGLPAETLLFYSFRDVMAWRSILTSNTGDDKRVELQMARLERVQQYAESHLCRRHILLNYFSEHLTEDCKNCDVCKNPRKRFDGTILAQKALSAVIRLNESVNMGILIDVLRGSRSQTIIEKGYDAIKTYGAGADLSVEEWREYLQQMVNTGILEIAYHQKYVLHRGLLSQQILQCKYQVWLVKQEITKARAEEAELKPRKSKTEMLAEQLLEQLKVVRKRIAEAQNIPPYIVFNDNTLIEMARIRPGNSQELLQISGVGQHKQELYGDAFLKEIREYVLGQVSEGTKVKGSTYLLTYELYKEGNTLEEIARQRNLNIVTIQSHIATLWERGYDIDIYAFISQKEVNEIKEGIIQMGEGELKTKELYEYFEEKYDYFKIRIALLFYQKDK